MTLFEIPSPRYSTCIVPVPCSPVPYPVGTREISLVPYYTVRARRDGLACLSCSDGVLSLGERVWVHTCDSTAWRADVLYSQTQLTSTAAQHSRTHNHTNSLPHALTTLAHAQSYMRRRTDAVGRLRADSATPVLHATATIALHAHATKHPRHTCHHRQHTHSARAHGACSHQPVFIVPGYVRRAAGCATRLGPPCFVSVGRFC